MRALYEEYKIILERKNSIGDSGGQSYTRYLFSEGINKILKKIGEESAELIVAAKDGDAGSVVGETADLLYHVLVMLAELGLDLSDVEAELEARAAKRGNLKQAKEVDKST